MKKIAGMFCTVLLAAGLSVAPAYAEEVAVSLPTFPVVLNGVTMNQTNNQYPMLVYKDITYVAMTYHDARLLGLESGWNDTTGLSINKAAVVADQATLQGKYVPYQSSTANAASYKAILPTFPVMVNYKAVDNATEEYPLLTFRDVTYFPLTWRFAVTEFGWQYSFDQTKGLVITPVPTPVTAPVTPTTPNGSATVVGTTVAVKGSNVNLRNGPGTNYGQIGQVDQGTRLTVLKEQDSWYQVKLSDGTTAWIASWLTEKSTSGSTSTGGSSSGTTAGGNTTAGTTVVVSGTGVNLRNGPGTDYAQIGTIDKGTELTIIKEQDSWYQIRLADGSTAWIATWLTEKSVPSQGVMTKLTLDSLMPTADQTILTLKHGQYNKVTTNSATSNQLVLTLGNTTLDESLNHLSLGIGPLQSVKAISTGSNAVQLTLGLKPGAYCTVKESGDNVTITVHNRQGVNETGLVGKTIVLDPGHGGSDPGAIGRVYGVTDAAVGLGVAQQLKTMLESAGAKVVMTRDSDVKVELYDRPALSNSVGADVFVSIHGNAAASNTAVNGIEVYYYAPSSNANLYAQQAVRQELANSVEQGMTVSTARKAATKTSNLAVLRENDSPSILVECGYLSNPEEELLMGSDAYRQKLAEGIYNGLLKYFNMY